MSRLLSRTRSQALFVDVQERLAPAMADFESALANMLLLARVVSQLGVPATISEQYPKGLGATLASLKEAFDGRTPILSKSHFSCGRDPAIAERCAALGRPQVVVCGIEAHVCVLQTAADLQTRGYEVFVAADAVDSRRPDSKGYALRRLESFGVALVSVEMAAFEWLECAGSEEFKAVSRLLR